MDTHLVVLQPETLEQALVMLERAAVALDDAVEFQSVRECRTTAVAAAAFAREAKDTVLLERAQRLKLNAERRAGEMLIASAEDGTRSAGGNPPGSNGRCVVETDATKPVTLADIGITRDQSSQWQALARMPRDVFDEAVGAVATLGGQVSTRAVIAVGGRECAAAAERLEDDDDGVSALVVEREQSTAEQSGNLMLHVAELARLNAAARDLMAAMPFYVVPSYRREAARVIALLQETLT